MKNHRERAGQKSEVLHSQTLRILVATTKHALMVIKVRTPARLRPQDGEHETQQGA